MLFSYNCLLFSPIKLSWDPWTHKAFVLESSYSQLLGALALFCANTLIRFQINDRLLREIFPHYHRFLRSNSIYAYNISYRGSKLFDFVILFQFMSTWELLKLDVIQEQWKTINLSLCPWSVSTKGDTVGENGKLPATHLSKKALVICLMANSVKIFSFCFYWDVVARQLK